MIITIDGYDMIEALQNYIKAEYGIEIDEETECILHVEEYKNVYQKNKNGEFKKKNGVLVLDEKKSEINNYCFMHPQNSATIDFFIKPTEEVK